MLNIVQVFLVANNNDKHDVWIKRAIILSTGPYNTIWLRSNEQSYTV